MLPVRTLAKIGFILLQMGFSINNPKYECKMWSKCFLSEISRRNLVLDQQLITPKIPKCHPNPRVIYHKLGTLTVSV